MFTYSPCGSPVGVTDSAGQPLTQGSMTILAVSAPSTGAARYTLRIAADAAEIAAAQRLRYRVFAGELGAALEPPVPGHDIDEFDAYCDHLKIGRRRVGKECRSR